MTAVLALLWWVAAPLLCWFARERDGYR